MKIAFVSDDGHTISPHFGRAAFYIVLTIEDGQIVTRETRDKIGHGTADPIHHRPGHAHHSSQHGHGFGAEAQARHGRMMAAIADCQMLVARGMGAGAYENLKQAGIQPLLTDIASIDEAIQAYLTGTLRDHPERAH